jgi:hypothetical protein
MPGISKTMLPFRLCPSMVDFAAANGFEMLRPVKFEVQDSVFCSQRGKGQVGILCRGVLLVSHVQRRRGLRW